MGIWLVEMRQNLRSGSKRKRKERKEGREGGRKEGEEKKREESYRIRLHVLRDSICSIRKKRCCAEERGEMHVE